MHPYSIAGRCDEDANKSKNRHTFETYYLGLMATEMDKRSKIIGKMTIMKTMRTWSLLVVLIVSTRVMMLILPCLVNEGKT